MVALFLAAFHDKKKYCVHKKWELISQKVKAHCFTME